MANADSTVHTISSKNWFAACAALSGATAIAQFLQTDLLQEVRGAE